VYILIISCEEKKKHSSVVQVLDEQKLQQVDSLWKEFETPEKANKV